MNKHPRKSKIMKKIFHLFSNLIQYHAVSRLISLFVFVLASFLFVTQFGAVGIAIALSLSMIVQKFYEFYAFNKYSEQN